MSKTLITLLLTLGLVSLASAQSHEDDVRIIKAQLVTAGVDLSGPCGAFQITKRVVWRLRAEGYGLLVKSGNNCEGYSTDAVILPSGLHYDILVDSGGANGPTWSIVLDEHTGQPLLRPGDYRPPFDPDPEVEPAPVPVPQPTPEPPPADDQLDRIEDKLDKHIESTEEFQKNVGSEWRAVKNFLKDKGLYILGAVLSGKFIWGN